MQKNKARSRFIVACVAPATILAIIFLLIPTLNVFRMSLFRWGGYSPNQEFVEMCIRDRYWEGVMFSRRRKHWEK